MTQHTTAETQTPEPPVQEGFDSRAFVQEIAELTWDLKALNTVVVDLRGRVSYTDFVVITTATSERHTQAIAKHVVSSLRDLGYRPMSTEGMDSGRWSLLDFGDAIVHVFNGDVRQEFDLEGMWLEAPRLELEDAPDDLYGHFEANQFS